MTAPDQPGALTRANLEARSLAELHELAARRGVERYRLLRREQLIDALAGEEAAWDSGDGREPEPVAAAETGEGLGIHEPDEDWLVPDEVGTDAPEAPEPGVAAGARVAEGGPARDRTRFEDEDEIERPPAAERTRPAERTRAPEVEEVEHREGVLDLMPEGYGFVRIGGLARSREDPYLSQGQVRALGLRSGDELAVAVRSPRRSERYPAVVEVESVNGRDPSDGADAAPAFEGLAAVGATAPLPLRAEPGDVDVRMAELAAPIAKGQRVLVAAPPGTGATFLLRSLARSLVGGEGPEPLVVLVEPRPEEVAEWERALGDRVHASTLDRPPDAHVRLAELALECSKRKVEQGRDTLLVIDSLTRLARARTLVRSRPRRGHGEGDPPEIAAVQLAKQWFGTGRATGEAGSLTVLASAHVESGTGFDDRVYEALSDLANVELRLDRALARAGMHPAIDLLRSRSSAEGALLGEGERERLAALRDELLPLGAPGAWRALSGRLRDSASNSELLGP